jgi:ribonuclease HI
LNYSWISFRGAGHRNKKKLANFDLWERLLDICEYHDVDFMVFDGANHNIFQKRCDELAEKAALSGVNGK